MDGVLNFIQAQYPLLMNYRYLLLFLGATIEGMNTLVLGGFLISMGKVAFIPTSLLLILGSMINGYAWYLVGYIGGSKPIDKWVRNDDKGRRVFERVEQYFDKYSGRVIVLTKFTFSLTITTLVLAGSLRYNLKKFSWYNFWGSLSWVTVTVAIGFFFGESFKVLFEHFLRNLNYLLIFLGLAVAMAYLIKLTFRSAFVRSLFLADRIRYFSDKIKYGLDKFVSNKDSNKRNSRPR